MLKTYNKQESSSRGMDRKQTQTVSWFYLLVQVKAYTPTSEGLRSYKCEAILVQV